MSVLSISAALQIPTVHHREPVSYTHLERDGILRVKAEMENLRRRTELDIEKAHKFAL